MRLHVALALTLLAACGGGSTGDDDDESVNCAEETRDDDFAVGLHKMGESNLLDFTFVSADPAPPARDDNTWVIQVGTPNGQAIAGATMTVTPYMRDHGHPSAKNVIVEPMPETGQYKLSPINMWMPGLWETTIDATSASGNDKVVFRFCVPS